MNVWIELINGPIRSEILQLELLCQELIESLPFIIVCAIAILFGATWLLAVLDQIFIEDGGMLQSQDWHEAGEKYRGSYRDKLSRISNWFSQDGSNAAA